MLVLSRTLGEKIVIGGNIVITVSRITRGQVRLAIEAPRSIGVFRGELLNDHNICKETGDCPHAKASSQNPGSQGENGITSV